jgi:hypothetical protein
MGARAEQGRIRALYVGWSPLPNDYVKHLIEAEPKLDLTVTTRYTDVLDALHGGYDYLILDEKKPQIDATKIACRIRNRGFSCLQIIIRRRRQGACRKREAILGVNVFLDGEKNLESARRLAETMRKLPPITPSFEVKREGLPAPIGD